MQQTITSIRSYLKRTRTVYNFWIRLCIFIFIIFNIFSVIVVNIIISYLVVRASVIKSRIDQPVEPGLTGTGTSPVWFDKN